MIVETLFVLILYYGYLWFIRRNEPIVDRRLRRFGIYEEFSIIIIGTIVGISLGYSLS